MPEPGPWVSWPAMTEHVEGIVGPLRKHIEDHDAWHLEQMRVRNRQLLVNLWSALTTLTAITAVIVTILHH